MALKSVMSLKIVTWILKKLLDDVEKLGGYPINLLSMTRLSVEQLQYARSFTNTMKESLKRICHVQEISLVPFLVPTC